MPVYLETGTAGPAGSITFSFGSASATRSFRVKVVYVECYSRTRAPADCVQYFTGASGSFQSYNFQGGTMLENQNYAVCIRQEECELMCSTMWIF